MKLKIKRLLNEGLYDHGIFKAVFLAGGPGSGKDFILKKVIAGNGLKEINSDHAFEFLMRKNNLSLLMPKSETDQRDKVRARAKKVTMTREQAAIAGRLGIIINSTAGDPSKIRRMKTVLERLGYETMMIFVNTSNETSRQRNIERGQRGGRTVPEDIRQEKWNEAQKNSNEFVRLFGKNFHIINNSTDLRKVEPEIKKKVENEQNQLFKTVRRFVDASIRNKAALSWIDGERKRRQITEDSAFRNLMPGLAHKLDSITKSKDFKEAIKIFVKKINSVKKKGEKSHNYNKTPQGIAAEVAKEMHLDPRALIKEIRKLIKQGTLPAAIMEEMDEVENMPDPTFTPFETDFSMKTHPKPRIAAPSKSFEVPNNDKKADARMDKEHDAYDHPFGYIKTSELPNIPRIRNWAMEKDVQVMFSKKYDERAKEMLLQTAWTLADTEEE